MSTLLLAITTLLLAAGLFLLHGALALSVLPLADAPGRIISALIGLTLAVILPLALAAWLRRGRTSSHPARSTLATILFLNLAQLGVLAATAGPRAADAFAHHGRRLVPNPMAPMVESTGVIVARRFGSQAAWLDEVETPTVAVALETPATLVESESTSEAVVEHPTVVVTSTPAALVVTQRTPPVLLDARRLFAARADTVLRVEIQEELDLSAEFIPGKRSKIAPLDKKILVRGHGSGFLVSSDGLFVTNEHVLGNAKRASVTIRNGRRFNGVEILVRDPTHDLVLARIIGTELPYAPVSTRAVDVGEPAFAIGSPHGLDFSLTEGIISAARDMHGTSLWQMQTDIASGSSGGPLFDERGEVIGVNTMGRGEGLNLAVQSRHVLALLEAERKSETLPPVREGLRVASISVEGRAASPLERERISFVAERIGSFVAECIRVLPRNARLEFQLQPFGISGNLHPADAECIRRLKWIERGALYLADGQEEDAAARRVEILLEGLPQAGEAEDVDGGTPAEERALTMLVERRAPKRPTE